MSVGLTMVRRLAADHPAFVGHFPGQPLLPGVVLLAEVIEAVRADAELTALLGPSPGIASVKFMAPVRPEGMQPIELSIVIQPQGSGVRFEVQRGAIAVARGQLVPGGGA